MNHKKIIFVFGALFLSLGAKAQEVREVSREWTSFSQSLEVATETSRKFILKGAVKTVTDDSIAWAGLWARVDTKGDERGFFDNMGDRPVKSPVWNEYTIEGTFDKNADKLVFGGLVLNDGDFYFDKLSLQIENDKGVMEDVPLGNAGFETAVADNIVEEWTPGITKEQITIVKEYKMNSSKDAYEGNYSLWIKGEGTEPGWSPTRIGEIEGYTPQIGVLITMLDDLKGRVKDRVKNLSTYELDHLHDEEANRIGALVMHLASAEVLYQNMTFENRRFNEEEQEKWGAALSLGDEGREKYKGKPVSYYLDEYEKVRERTKELFKTVDDEWLQNDIPSSGMTNYFGWFHVIEHQSSHLGQILFLSKRIPPEPALEKKEEIKD